GIVSGEDPRASRGRRDAEARPRGDMLHGSEFDVVREIANGVETVHAVLLEDRVVDLVASRQHSRVRRDRLLAGVGTTRLHHGDRLASILCPLERLDEAPAVSHALDVSYDRGDLRVVDRGVEHIGESDIHLVARAQHRAQPDALALAGAEDEGPHGPALREEGHTAVAELEAVLVEASVDGRAEVDPRRDKTHAVRSEHARLAARDTRLKLRLHGAPLLTRLREAGRDDDDGGDLLLDTVAQRGVHVLARG